MREFGKWEIHERLGKGLQGEVFKAIHKENGKVAALKFIDKSALTQTALKNLEREVNAMKALAGHNNVVQMLDVDFEAKFPMKNGETKDTVALILELAEGGELFNYLMFTGRLDEKLARTYFKQLITGLGFCHSKGVTHRDIKAENILLDGKFNLKIADFGLSSRHEEEGAATKLKTTCGTPGYMAPEILAGGRYEGPPTDIWSAGILLFIMLTGFPPLQRASKGDWWFDRITHKQMSYFWGAHLKNAPDFPQGAQELLNKIFVANANERATLADIQADAWFKGECCTLNDLAAELGKRKAQVDATMAQQKADQETAAAAKAAKKKRRRRRNNADEEFDAFDEDAYRGMGDEDDAEAKEDGAAAAEAPAGDSISTLLYAKLAAPPEDIMKQAHEETNAISA